MKSNGRSASSRSRKKLHLGKGSAFVKSNFRRLPLIEDVWEADIQLISEKLPGQTEFWLGMVVEQEGGGVLASLSLDQPPTVNDLAKVLGHAMNRPLTECQHHRPTTILLRPNPEWDELLPHLRQLGIDIISIDALPVWSEAAQEFGIEWERRLRSLRPPREPTILEALFPTVSKWVQRGGWIEIGEQQEAGFLVRALDEGGLVYESTKAKTLDEAMTLLEQGIVDWLEENGVDLG